MKAKEKRERDKTREQSKQKNLLTVLRCNLKKLFGAEEDLFFLDGRDLSHRYRHCDSATVVVIVAATTGQLALFCRVEAYIIVGHVQSAISMVFPP